jgi:hypothetical protein
MNESDELLESLPISYSSVDRRRQIVSKLHRLGLKLTEIAASLVKVATGKAPSLKTVVRDCVSLGLLTFTDISDDELIGEVADILTSLHSSVGIRTVDSQLLLRGHRVQERRIRFALVSGKFTCH